MTDESTDSAQSTLRMTENQGNHVALAQRVHAQLMAEAQGFVNQGNAKVQEAQTVLRQAVEGAFKEQGLEIPTAEVRIVNDERGRPSVLVWAEPEADASEPAPTASLDAEESAPEPVKTKEKPKAQATSPAVNGKAVPPEAARRKLPIK